MYFVYFIQHKNGGDGRDGAPVSLDVVAVHPDCWCDCLYYLHFAPENTKGGKMYLLVPAHPGCPGQSPESCKMVVCVCVFYAACFLVLYSVSPVLAKRLAGGTSLKCRILY